LDEAALLDEAPPPSPDPLLATLDEEDEEVDAEVPPAPLVLPSPPQPAVTSAGQPMTPRIQGASLRAPRELASRPGRARKDIAHLRVHRPRRGRCRKETTLPDCPCARGAPRSLSASSRAQARDYRAPSGPASGASPRSACSQDPRTGRAEGC